MGISRVFSGPELVLVRAASLLTANATPIFDVTPIRLGVSHVVNLRLEMVYTAPAAGNAFEFTMQVRTPSTAPGGQETWHFATIDNLGVLAILVAPPLDASRTQVDTAIKGMRPASAAGVFQQDFSILLNRSASFIRFSFAEYGIPLAPGDLVVRAIMTGA